MTLREYQMILLDGHLNHKEFLANHIKREAIKAKERNVPTDEFFIRCNNVIKVWVNHLDTQIYERKKELHIIIGITNSQEIKTQCEDELNTISRNDFRVQLAGLTNQIFGGLTYNDILEIKKAIKDSNSVKNDDYTHREYCLAHEYKMTAYPKDFTEPTAKELKDISSKRYRASQSLQKGHRYFKAVTKKEIENAIKLLSDYPKAEKLASEYLKTSFKD